MSTSFECEDARTFSSFRFHFTCVPPAVEERQFPFSRRTQTRYLPLNAENPNIGFRGSRKSQAQSHESMPVLATRLGSSAQFISVTVRWWAFRMCSIEVLPTRKRFQIKLYKPSMCTT